MRDFTTFFASMRVCVSISLIESIDKSLDNRFFHTGPNGIIYRLDILTDEKSPKVAPRRYAVALDTEDVVVLTGPKSFAADTDILLNEIKFRIDNQLS